MVEVPLCEIDGQVLGVMQFVVLLEVLFCEIDGRARGHAVWGVGGGAVLQD